MMNAAMSQPPAGASEPPNVFVPHPASMQVARIAASSPIATSGTGGWLYWKLPTTPCTTPSTKMTT